MPLNATAFKDAIAALKGDNSPATVAAAAQAWADATQALAAGVIPASTTVAAAAATLKAEFESAWSQTTSTAAASKLETGFAAFAATVGGGMTAGGYTGTPPAGQVGFASLLSTNQPSLDDAAQAWADAIKTWMETGTGTLIVPPNTVVPWS